VSSLSLEQFILCFNLLYRYESHAHLHLLLVRAIPFKNCFDSFFILSSQSIIKIEAFIIESGSQPFITEVMIFSAVLI
jgi:uncharacterized membrane protein SirB2